jgi:CRISPR-associated protein Cmr5
MNGLEERKGRTMEQQRAAFALKKIQQLSGQKDNAKEAALYIRKLPAMTFGNGLGQALAFLLAKTKSNDEKTLSVHPAGQVYLIVAEWLVENRKVYSGKPTDLLESMMNNNREQYMIAQEEAWALLDWLKKFADALLPTDESETAIVEGK